MCKLKKILFFLILISLALSGKAWRLEHHKLMTEHALKQIKNELPNYVNIGNIINHADRPDITMRHCTLSCHRVKKYQNLFEDHLGKRCDYEGAELWAAYYLEKAREAFINNNQEHAEELLGYATHYIYDAVCISHVFPFNEGVITGFDAHGGFERYAERQYKKNLDWQDAVKNAEIKEITDTYDLLMKIRSIAGEVFKFYVEFLSENGYYYVYSDGELKEKKSSDKKLWEKDPWKIEDADVKKAIRLASGLVKGAAKWVFQEKLIKADAIRAYNLAAEYINKLIYDKAISELDKAIKLAPDFQKAYYLRGLAYCKLGLQKFEALYSISSRVELQDRLNDVGFPEMKKAIDDFTKAIELNPSDPEAYCGRGNAWLELASIYSSILRPDFITYELNIFYDEAISDFTKAINLKANYAEAYYGRAAAFFGKGDKRALEDVRKAEKLGYKIDPIFYRGLKEAFKKDIK
jgi:tetratricopeptide (TPR) repeat protein